MLVTYVSKFNPFTKLSQTINLLLLIAFIECIGGGLAYYLSLYLGTCSSFSKLQIGQVSTFLGLGSLIGAFSSIFISNKINNKANIIFSLIVLGFSFIGLSLKLEFYFCIIFAYLVGFSTNIFLTSNNTLILSSIEQDLENLKLIQSIKAVCENLGSSCSVILLMFFAAKSYGSLFEVTGIIYIILGINSIKFLNLTYGKNLLVQNKSQIKDLEIINKNNFYSSIVGLFIVGMIYSQQRVAYPLFLQDKYANFTITALLFWLDPIIVSLFQVKVTKKMASLTIHKQLAYGGFLLGIGLFLLIFSNSILITIFACLIFILGEMMFMPCSFIFCYESVGTSHKGLASGAWRSAYMLGLTVGPLISGLLMEHFNYNYCWMFSGILGATLFALFNRRRLYCFR